MSFKDYSGYIYGFDLLDQRLSEKASQEKYYNKWMRKYADIFNCKDVRITAIEWDLRCRKSLREIFSSATFFVEAVKTLEMRCFSSYYFCMYYSLFHAIYASIFLDADSNIDKLLGVTHRNIINIFKSAFANSKADIMAGDINLLFADLKYKREYYSYVTPFNNLFDYKQDLEVLRCVLKECYQLTSFHSLLVEKSYDKNVGKVIKLSNKNELNKFDNLFYCLFSKKDRMNEHKIDDSCIFLRNELLRYGFKPEYIVLDLDHQFDEFHTYDGFDDEQGSEDGLNISTIWSFVANPLYNF